MPRCTTALSTCLLRPTLFYCCPLCPTLGHIIGRFWLLSRGKSVRSQKKLSTTICRNMREITAIRCVLCIGQNLFLVFVFSEQVRVPNKQTLILQPGLPALHQDPTVLSLFLSPAAYAMLRVSLIPSRSAAHGMGYASTRRDRPELRNQLVRQRRAVITPSHLGYARFLFTLSSEGKRALCISYLLHSPHHYMCRRAR